MIENAPFNGPLSINELAAGIHEISQGIERDEAIWKVSDEAPYIRAALGPPTIARFDLVDEEYG